MHLVYYIVLINFRLVKIMKRFFIWRRFAIIMSWQQNSKTLQIIIYLCIFFNFNLNNNSVNSNYLPVYYNLALHYYYFMIKQYVINFHLMFSS